MCPLFGKDAVVVTLTKSSRPKVLNDFRPVALTSVVIKVFEKNHQKSDYGRD